MKLSEFKDIIVSMPVAYQAFTSKKSTWEKHMSKDEAGQALHGLFANSDEVTISRSDLRSFAEHPHLAKFIMATIIWGYPSGMRGNHVADITGKIGDLTMLLSTVRNQPIEDWVSHFQAISRIKGLGLSTYTKFLNFLSAKIHNHPALILDDRIIRIATSGTFEELKPIQHLNSYNAVRSYPQYLSCMCKLEDSLDVAAENIEFFLFEFGLNLKPLEGLSSNP